MKTEPVAKLERLKILEGIARGEKAILEGKVFPEAEAEKRMNKWLDAAS